MAICETCGKKPSFGNQRSHSMKATRRKFKPNLQKVTVMQQGVGIRKTLCTKCIKALSKDS
ncbi:MAG: 50S ribosomal protein L28 [Chitinophagaceae bacterium]|nr:50S ribosomal protein L28 [Anaerolineae bacterium]